jgi:transcriptional regulator with XRE-family HTH domain
MYAHQLKNIMISRDLTQADVARLAHVSRAAVTKWLKHCVDHEWINVETKTLFQLAKSLGLKPSLFLEKGPDLLAFETQFLWDRFYPNMESFVKALRDKDLPAYARLVQVLGFRQAEYVVGKDLIKKFPDYKKHIKPVRRKQLGIVWPLYNHNGTNTPKNEEAKLLSQAIKEQKKLE